MTGKLKALGIVLAAAIAIGALTASAASAQNGRLTSDGPVTLIGTQTSGVTNNQLGTFGSFTTTCANATYTGHKFEVTPHELIPNSAETITVTSHLGLCSTNGLPTTVDVNGCDLVLHLTTTNGTDSYAITTTTVCPSEKHVTLTIWSSKTAHEKNETPICDVTITTAASLNGLSAVDNTNGTGKIEGKITEGMTAERHSPTGSILCKDATDEKATVQMEVTVKGLNSSGKETAISLSHT